MIRGSLWHWDNARQPGEPSNWVIVMTPMTINKNKHGHVARFRLRRAVGESPVPDQVTANGMGARHWLDVAAMKINITISMLEKTVPEFAPSVRFRKTVWKKQHHGHGRCPSWCLGNGVYPPEKKRKRCPWCEIFSRAHPGWKMKSLFQTVGAESYFRLWMGGWNPIFRWWWLSFVFVAIRRVVH